MFLAGAILGRNLDFPVGKNRQLIEAEAKPRSTPGVIEDEGVDDEDAADWLQLGGAAGSRRGQRDRHSAVLSHAARNPGEIAARRKEGLGGRLAVWRRS